MIFYSLMNKKTIKSKHISFSLNSESEIIVPYRNNEKVARYVIPYEICFDNAVSITEFDLSLKSYSQKMKNGNVEYNLNKHELSLIHISEPTRLV